MPYRPDPIFDDSLQPDVSMSARNAVSLTVAATLSLCFAAAVSGCLLVRAVVNAPGRILKQLMR